MEDVYEKLAGHLENTPGGFPKTPTGVELRILKQLFTPEQAGLCTDLIMMPETAKAIADRTGRVASQIEPLLKEMGEKGLIVHIERNGENTFMLLNFVVGIWEYQVNTLTKELIKDFNEYVPYLTKEQFNLKTKQLRVVPVAQSINTQMDIMDYEEAESLIRSQSRIVVAPCICRKEHHIMEKGCDKPVETCLVFGGGAHIYERRNVGRVISQDEAVEILHNGIRNGLVIQPSNAQKPINMCLCCSCCCQILKNLKTYDVPGKIVSSNYHAQIDPDNCTGCGECIDICPMTAIEMADDHTASVTTDRCIGCGLCHTRCDFDSISMVERPEGDRIDPPKNIVETYMAIAKEKGLF